MLTAGTGQCPLLDRIWFPFAAAWNRCSSLMYANPQCDRTDADGPTLAGAGIAVSGLQYKMARITNGSERCSHVGAL
jgi:hypothetical protein